MHHAPAASGVGLGFPLPLTNADRAHPWISREHLTVPDASNVHPGDDHGKAPCGVLPLRVWRGRSALVGILLEIVALPDAPDDVRVPGGGECKAQEGGPVSE